MFLPNFTYSILILLFIISSFSSSGQVQIGLDLYGDSSEYHLGDRMVMSSDGNTIAARIESDTNAIHIYKWDGTTWVLNSTIIEEYANTYFGTGLCLNGDGTIIAIGSPGFDMPGLENVGSIHILHWDGFSWNQMGQTLMGTLENEKFGQNLDMSFNGQHLLVGVPQHPNNLGKIYTYKYDGTVG